MNEEVTLDAARESILTPGSSSGMVPTEPRRTWVSQCQDTAVAVCTPSVPESKK